jgi:RimJ/RimL family protein N-acetyltransferase
MVSQLSIRKISIEDFEFWCQLLPGTSFEDFETLFVKLRIEEEQDKSYSFILENAKRPVGFIQVFNVLRRPSHSGMIEIMISETERKFGYGKKGITLLENFCFKNQNLRRLIAPISAENEASKALFTSLGYHKYFTDPSAFFFDGKPIPHEIWVKIKPD